MSDDEHVRLAMRDFGMQDLKNAPGSASLVAMVFLLALSVAAWLTAAVFL